MNDELGQFGKGSAWANKSAKGNAYINGNIVLVIPDNNISVKVKFIMFESRDKRTEKSPDYSIFINEYSEPTEQDIKRLQENKSSGRGNYQPPAQKNYPPAAPTKPPADHDDDIPF